MTLLQNFCCYSWSIMLENLASFHEKWRRWTYLPYVFLLTVSAYTYVWIRPPLRFSSDLMLDRANCHGREREKRSPHKQRLNWTQMDVRSLCTCESVCRVIQTEDVNHNQLLGEATGGPHSNLLIVVPQVYVPLSAIRADLSHVIFKLIKSESMLFVYELYSKMWSKC